MISTLEQKVILKEILYNKYIPQVKLNVSELLTKYHKQVVEDINCSLLIGSDVSTQTKPMIFEISKQTEQLIEDILIAFNKQ